MQKASPDVCLPGANVMEYPAIWGRIPLLDIHLDIHFGSSSVRHPPLWDTRIEGDAWLSDFGALIAEEAHQPFYSTLGSLLSRFIAGELTPRD